MAAPVIASVGTLLDSDATSTSVTLAAPASIAAGDLLVAIFGNDDAATDNVTAAPSGWTQRVGQTHTSQSCGTIYVYTKTADSGDESATDYTWTLNNPEARCGQIFRVTGANTTTPVNAANSSESASPDTTMTYPSITTDVDDCLIFAIGGPNGNTPYTTEDDSSNYISGYSGRFSRNLTGFGFVVQTAVLASHGATGTKTSVITSAAQHWTTAQIAIAPAAGGGVSQPITPATETDTAQALGKQKLKAIGTAVESDTAQALTAAKAQAISQALETDTAITFAAAKQKAISPALEADTALPLSTLGEIAQAISAALEADAALPIGKAKIKAIGTAAETDTALPLAFGNVKYIQPALEADQAISLGRQKIKAIGTAVETDSALSLSTAIARAIGTAIETNTALAFTHYKQRALSPAVETDLALTLTRYEEPLPYTVKPEFTLTVGRENYHLIVGRD